MKEFPQKVSPEPALTDFPKIDARGTSDRRPGSGRTKSVTFLFCCSFTHTCELTYHRSRSYASCFMLKMLKTVLYSAITSEDSEALDATYRSTLNLHKVCCRVFAITAA